MDLQEAISNANIGDRETNRVAIANLSTAQVEASRNDCENNAAFFGISVEARRAMIADLQAELITRRNIRQILDTMNAGEITLISNTTATNARNAVVYMYIGHLRFRVTSVRKVLGERNQARPGRITIEDVRRMQDIVPTGNVPATTPPHVSGQIQLRDGERLLNGTRSIHLDGREVLREETVEDIRTPDGMLERHQRIYENGCECEHHIEYIGGYNAPIKAKLQERKPVPRRRRFKKKKSQRFGNIVETANNEVPIANYASEDYE